MSSLAQETLMGSSSVETEIIAATAAVDIAIDEGQQRDDDLYDYNRELERERHERRMARLALRDQISENGFALRKAFKNESIKGYFPSPLQMEEMSIEDIMTEISVEDLRYVGSIKDRIYMPALFFQKWVLPTIRVRKALEQSHNGELPGGMEAAMLASIFDQSVMDLNKPVSTNIADNEALRAMVYHTKDDKTHQFHSMEEGRKGLTKGLMSALQKLKQVAKLPDEKTLFRMNSLDIESQNAEIAEAITQYEDHVKRDHDNMIMLREQNALMARLVWEQQIHICDLNERYLQMVEENKRLTERDDMSIQNDIFDIAEIMKNLEKSLKQRQEEVSKIFTPIDFQQIKSTMTKLKSALISINMQNTQLVKKNNSLTLQLSMVTEEMRKQITQAIQSHSSIVTNQRTDPHCLVPERETRFVFQRSVPNDPIVSELQRCNHFSSVDHLLNEVEDVMNIIKSSDTNVDVDVGIDEEDQGEATQDANSIAPLRVTKAREVISMATDQNATKRSHDSIAYNGPRVRLSKIQRMSPSEDDINHSSSAAILKSTFTGMIAQSAYVQRTNSSFISQDGERFSSRVDKNPFAPVGQNIVAYNVTQGNASSSTDAHSIRPKSRTNKNAKKCKSRASTRKVKKGKANLPKKRKDNIPYIEQCHNAGCRQRGTHLTHRHVDCRFQNKDQGSRSDSQSQVIYSALADFKSQSGGTENYQSQSAIRPGYDNLGGRGY